MRRRDILAMGALGSLGLGLGLGAVQPRKERWPALGSGVRLRLERPRRVVIVGGGLAGMACAWALAARGYAVTLCERSDALGGKLAGWPIVVDGEEVPMEHGFHGFFHQYYNLRALLAAASADRDLVPQDEYTILFRSRPPESFRAGYLPFPVNLLEVLARSQRLGFADVAGDRPGMTALLSYDPVSTFARWDGIDAESFVREGRLDGAFADLVLRPFGQASMNALDRLSAAELVRFFHFYMLGNPDGLGFDALGRGVHISVLAPLRAMLVRLGVDVRTSTAVRRVVTEGGRAIGVAVASPSEGSILRIASAEVPAEGWVSLDGGAVFVRRTAGGYEARDARCTHMGCRVLREGSGFVCPCHAGRYDEEGTVLSGPPPRPLASKPILIEGDQLVIGTTALSETVIAADAVVLATEVGGFRSIVSASDLSAAPALVAAAEAAGEADPYAVVRFWFDKPTDPSRSAFYTVSEYEWTDSLAIYSAFQEPFTASARTRRSVVETHAYSIPAALQGSLSSYRDALLSELRQAFPELSDAAVTHEEAMTQSNFTRFSPGDFMRRPTVATEIPNLLVAGDHVQLPFPAFLMEAAVSSGLLAANTLCARDGVEEQPIWTVALRGPLASLLG